MGADLIIEYVIIENGDVNKEKEMMLKGIDKLNEKGIEDLKKFFEDECSYIVGKDIGSIKKEFGEIVEEVLEKGYRDTTYFEHKGDTIFLTGGMSWGDSPTESCDSFHKYNLIKSMMMEDEEKINSTLPRYAHLKRESN